MTRPLRFGILGAAKIAPRALIEPARLGSKVKAKALAPAAGGEDNWKEF